eukprot:4767284-Prymnesium_polylepis.1
MPRRWREALLGCDRRGPAGNRAAVYRSAYRRPVPLNASHALGSEHRRSERDRYCPRASDPRSLQLDSRGSASEKPPGERRWPWRQTAATVASPPMPGAPRALAVIATVTVEST